METLQLPQYKVAAFKGNRFAIYLAGKVVDDAQGYGYKTAPAAYKILNFRFNGGREKQADDKKSFMEWKKHDLHKQLVTAYTRYLNNFFFDMVKDGETSSDVLKEFETKYGVTIPKVIFNYIIKTC